MTAGTGERLDVGAIVGDIDIPCEARRHDLAPVDAPAEWVVWQIQCCPARRPYGLACTPCLTRWFSSTHPSACPECGDVVRRLRDRIVRFERINKPPTGNPPAGT